VSYVRSGLAIVFALAVISVPFALINSGFTMIGMSTDETLHTLLRLCALLGISFLFLQIVTGAFRPALRRVFKPRVLHKVHTAFGIAGLSFILAHFILLIPSIGEHWAALNHGFFVLGPIMLFVLFVTVTTALVLRRMMPNLWNQLHVLNYAIFAVAIVHALGIGTQAGLLATKLILAGYVLIALAGFAYRASSPEWRRRRSLPLVRVRSGRNT
jgi:DMSO/TMAO reductase YedYZ heme-binding membrane subunit